MRLRQLTHGSRIGDPLRMYVRRFPTMDDAHRFLNKQCDNTWSIYDGPHPPGRYVQFRGAWVKANTPEARVSMGHIL